MGNVVMVERNIDGSKKTITGTCDHTDYEVVSRLWVASDGGDIREWTRDEYVNWNPNETKVVQYPIDGRFIDVVGHCVEIRQVFVHNGNGIRVCSFIEEYDYNKEE